MAYSKKVKHVTHTDWIQSTHYWQISKKW